MHRRSRAILFLALIGMAGSAEAAVPKSFSVQGVLRDKQGQLQSMTLPMVLRFFPMQTGGTQIGSDYDLGSVPVVAGLFTVAQQTPNILTDLQAATGDVWMELEINAERYPRQLITPEPYALMCSVADSLSASCTGCVTTAMEASPAGVKQTAPTSLNGSLNGPAASPTTITSVNITVPNSGGAVLVTVGNGTFGFYNHNSGVNNHAYCCITQASDCEAGFKTHFSVPTNLPASAGSSGDEFVDALTYPLALTRSFAVAPGTTTFSASLVCRIDRGGQGGFVEPVTLQALYLPKQY